MSRCGYSDDLDQQDLAMWRGRVMSAIRGKRGQRLLIDMRDALDAMPEKILVANWLVDGDGDVCALGAVGQKRGVKDLAAMDPEDHDKLAATFDVAACLIQEIEYMNDEWGTGQPPEKRWERMRKWCDGHIVKS